MILNNYLTMQRIRELREQPLTSELVLDLHRLVSADTLVPRQPPWQAASVISAHI
jgi:hypothetical protein